MRNTTLLLQSIGRGARWYEKWATRLWTEIWHWTTRRWSWELRSSTMITSKNPTTGCSLTVTVSWRGAWFNRRKSLNFAQRKLYIFFSMHWSVKKRLHKRIEASLSHVDTSPELRHCLSAFWWSLPSVPADLPRERAKTLQSERARWLAIVSVRC